MSGDVLERDLEERKFMHDLATPLGTASMVVQMLVEDLKGAGHAAPAEQGSLLQLAEQAQRAVARMETLIRDRREFVKSRFKKDVP